VGRNGHWEPKRTGVGNCGEEKIYMSLLSREGLKNFFPSSSPLDLIIVFL
jgi:hypothetical protein